MTSIVALTIPLFPLLLLVKLPCLNIAPTLRLLVLLNLHLFDLRFSMLVLPDRLRSLSQVGSIKLLLPLFNDPFILLLELLSLLALILILIFVVSLSTFLLLHLFEIRTFKGCLSSFQTSFFLFTSFFDS